MCIRDRFDSSTAIVETLTGEVSTLDERDVATYNAAFDEFASVGAFGADAECFLDECMRLLNNLQPNPARPAADEIHSHAR